MIQIPKRLVPLNTKRVSKPTKRMGDLSDDEEEENKKFRCEVCPDTKGFKTFEDLKRHCLRGKEHKKNAEKWQLENGFIQNNTELCLVAGGVPVAQYAISQAPQVVSETSFDEAGLVYEILPGNFDNTDDTTPTDAPNDTTPNDTPNDSTSNDTPNDTTPNDTALSDTAPTDTAPNDDISTDKTDDTTPNDTPNDTAFSDTAPTDTAPTDCIHILEDTFDFFDNSEDSQEYFEFEDFQTELEDLCHLDEDFDMLSYKAEEDATKYTSKLGKCGLPFQNEKTKEFTQIFIKNTATKELQQDIMDFIAKHYSDPEIPTSNYFLDSAIDFHNPTYEIYEQEIRTTSVSFYQIREILISILESGVDLIYEYEEVAKKSQENHFEMWRTLQHDKLKTLFLKLFIDEYELTKRRKKKANGVVLTLANFKPDFQRSIESKYILSVFPPDPKHKNFYHYIFNVIVLQIQDLQQNPIKFGGEEFHVELLCLLGDQPGQSQAAGVTGYYGSLMPNLKCEGDLLVSGRPCKPRDVAESKKLIMSAGGVLQRGIRGSKSFTSPPSPLWLLLEENYFERFATCRMHTMYEGMAPLILQSIGNEHTKEFRDDLESKLQKLKNEKFGLKSFFFETTNRFTKKKEVRLSLATAREKKHSMYILWTLLAHHNGTDAEEKKIVFLYLQIDRILCLKEITQEDIEELDELTKEFRDCFHLRYQNSEWTTIKRPKFDSLLHFGDTIRNLGLPDSYDTVYSEAVWFQNSFVVSNNKNLRRDTIVQFERRRTHRPPPIDSQVFSVKSHCCISCNKYSVGHYYKKIFVGDNKVEIGESVQINWVLPGSTEVLGPIFGKLDSIYFEHGLRTLMLDLLDYIVLGEDEFGQQLIQQDRKKWVSWGLGSKIIFTKISVGSWGALKFVNKFWKKELVIDL